jgi:hypothetical protein
MPSYAPVYFSRRTRRGISLKAGALRRRAVTAIPAAVRALATQTKKGPGRPSTGAMSGGSATRTTQGVSTQTGTGTRTVTSTRVKSTKALFKGTPARLQVKTADQMVRANTRTIKQVFQQMNEIDIGYGALGLSNSITVNQCPLHAYCLTTIDRPNADLGNTAPLFILERDSKFLPVSGLPVVFGNMTNPVTGGTADALSATGRLVLSSIMIKLLFWARTDRSTTYDIAIMRFKGNSQHLAPYLTPEEDVSITGLSADQLSERKAFWIDHMLRHMTVNPVALTKDSLSRMKKYYEVMYHKEITIDEHLNNDEDENDRHFEQINLPVNMVKNFNYSVNSRYDDNTNEARIDQAINTATNDIFDVNQYHKCNLHSNIWLIIKANNATTVSSAGNGGEVITENGNVPSPLRPSYDLSFECKYKTFSTQ